MPKDILLYGAIWEYNAFYFFEQIKEALKDDPTAQMELRINCEGGSPEYAMSMIAKLQEMGDQFSIKGEAQLYSMALFFLCYVPADKIEVLDVSKGLLHRAAYPEWVESSASFKGSMYDEILSKTNKDLEKAFRNRVNVEALEALPQFTEKNITLKDIFSMEGRAEVLLTASDLKKIGLVKNINKITPSKSTEMAAMFDDFKKCRTVEEFRMAAQSTPAKVETVKNTTMTLEELKANHPALYAQIVALGVTQGVTQERDRVGAWTAFVGIDAEAVVKGIKGGESISQTAAAEFTVKALSAQALKLVAANNPPAIVTSEAAAIVVPKTAAQLEIDAFEANMRKELGLKK